MVWWHWMVLGLVLLGLEILTLGGLGKFYFLYSLASRRLMVGAIVWVGLSEPHWLQWCLFAFFGIVSLFVLRRPLQNKMNGGETSDDPVDSMVGEVATAVGRSPRTGGREGRASRVNVDGSQRW